MSHKVAIITGAGSGIGQDFAIALIRKGWQVVLAGRRKEALELTLANSGSPASRVWIAPTDITQELEVRALFDGCAHRFGRLDLVFNNAGVNTPAVPLEQLTYDQWRSVIDTNITGVFLCIREAFRIMKNQNPQGGRIINNGSISAHVPRPNSAPYTSSKHAVTGLTKSASLDGRAYNIAVGQIDIGNASTSMAGPMTTGVPQANGTIAIEPTMPLSHVTEALLYMASLPLESNVPFMTVMANGMPYIGRG